MKLTSAADDVELHRQLRRRRCRMRKSHENEATCKDWYATTFQLGFRPILISGIGDRIIVVVQKQRNFTEAGPGATVSTSAANKVRRGDIRHAVVVRTAKKLQRPDGSVVKFDDNACVLINKAGEPIGTRLNGWFKAFVCMIFTNSPRCRRSRAEEDEVVEDTITGTNASVGIL